jgi:CheY-like chemotaxis protein
MSFARFTQTTITHPDIAEFSFSANSTFAAMSCASGNDACDSDPSRQPMLEVGMTDLIDASHRLPKMLVADDDPSIVRLIAERCASAGFEVETASNGIQALLRANRSQPDILIIDVNMPKADGLSVCAQLRNPTRNSFNIVVVTARQDPATVTWCKRLGAFYAHKGPDFWNDLASALGEVFPGMTDKLKKLNIQPSDTQVRTRPRVLVVDDDEDIKHYFASRLHKCGVEILYAPDSRQAFQMACKEEPSVIVCDFFMPNGDALYLLSRLRTMPATANIPVFVISGRWLDETTRQNLTREICGRPGAVRIFKKSFDTNELFGELQLFCGFNESSLKESQTA